MKGKVSIFCLALLFLVSLTILGNAQPVAVIMVESLSPWDVNSHNVNTTIDTNLYMYPSTGLRTVGNNSLVYLSGHEAGDSVITGYTWSILSQPTGSVATLDSTSSAWTTFRPDVVGDYVIGLTINTDAGPADGSITIVSANYVGIGNVTDPASLTGCICHNPTKDDWAMTGHSDMLVRGLNWTLSNHYGESCLDCHTVGNSPDTLAVNNGFDDVAKDLGWIFPDSTMLKMGGWDSLATNFPTLARLGNIQCENCHGPASEHAATLSKAKIDISLDEGVCGRCHEDGHYHVKNTQWKKSGHGSGTTFARGTSTSCAPCHSGWGFIAAVDPASDLDQKTGNQNISCAVCHDPHSVANEHQLRRTADVTLASGPTISLGGNGKLCMNCHKNRRVGGGEAYAKNPTSTYRGPHHSNQTEMFAGIEADVITYGIPMPNSTHKDVVKDGCVGCHMAANAREDLGDHSWAMHTTEIVGVDTMEYHNVTACVQCHDPTMTSFDDILARADHDGDGTIEAATAEVEGLMHDIAMMLPPLDTPTVDIRAPVWNTKEGLQLRRAAWNYFFVDYDHSHGIHNYQFAVALLKRTKAALTFGVLSPGVIANIDDVPNDQGKQVRLSWTRFGGDGISDIPVQFYGIWRKVDNMARSANGDAVIYESVEELPVNANALTEGVKLNADGHLWDFVSSVPAAGNLMYSTVAPTLFDSTATGVHWSHFIISGHTAVPALVVKSMPDSGYSIDNLVPAAPMNLAGQPTEAGVALTWDEPVDDDFNYFAIYRSDLPGFDPSTMEPIGTTAANDYVDADVVENSNYYYVLSAVDFSGNESEFSGQLAVTYTSIGGFENAIPTDFVLDQNYPNPFNPTTSIRFGLPSVQDVKIVIYDILGKPIRTLVNSQYSAGYHSVVWDGMDNSGNVISAGVYIYRLESSAKTVTKKMLLVK
jgi:hypothetical protein